MSFLKKIAKAVTAPVKAAANVVSNVAQGDIKGAAKSAVSVYTSSVNPVLRADIASDGAVSSLAASAPVVGSSMNKFFDSSRAISLSGGDVSGDVFRTMVREGAKLGGATAGFTYAAPIFGAGNTAVGASALSQGNLAGAASAFAPGLEGLGKGLLPDGFQDVFDQYGNVLRGIGSNIINAPKNPDTPTQIIASPSNSGGAVSLNPVMVALLIGGAGFMIMKAARKK